MSDLFKLREQRAQCMRDIENAQKLSRLCALRDWQDLMEQGFLQEACAKAVHDSVNPALEERAKNHAMDMARAAGFLHLYLENIENQGQRAKESLPQLQAAMDAAQAEVL